MHSVSDLFIEGFGAAMAPPDGRECTYVGGYAVEHGKTDGGCFATLHSGALWETGCITPQLVSALAEVVRSIAPRVRGRVLVLALGNESVCADRVGADTVRRLLTGKLDHGACLMAARLGVRAQTGISSSRLASAIAEAAVADAVVLVDSLAAMSAARLGTLVQVSDCAIRPGSGAAAHEDEISKKTLGRPTVVIGVPSVVRDTSSGTLCAHAMCERLSEGAGALIAGALNLLAAGGA